MQRKGQIILILLVAWAAFAAGEAAAQFVKRVIAVHNFPWRSLSGQISGLGRLEDVIGGSDLKYPYIGGGGELVVDMGQGTEIFDRPGTDFTVYEVGTSEHYWVLGAQSVGGPWRLVGYGIGVDDFDLAGSELPWVRYLALIDYECVVEGTPSEGADFDAVHNAHPPQGGDQLTPVAVTPADMIIGKWRYDGRFNQKPIALPNLLKSYDDAIRPPLPSAFDYVDSDVSDKFFSSPILYMLGHRDFVLSTQQQEALKEYVARGGFVFADACCGSQPFADAFYREFGRALPKMGFVKLPPDHEIYHCFYSLKADSLPLYALVQDDRAVVVFSHIGLSCSWEGPTCLGSHNMVQQPQATQLGVNLIVYALTH